MVFFELDDLFSTSLETFLFFVDLFWKCFTKDGIPIIVHIATAITINSGFLFWSFGLVVENDDEVVVVEGNEVNEVGDDDFNDEEKGVEADDVVEEDDDEAVYVEDEGVGNGVGEGDVEIVVEGNEVNEVGDGDFNDEEKGVEADDDDDEVVVGVVESSWIYNMLRLSSGNKSFIFLICSSNTLIKLLRYSSLWPALYCVGLFIIIL